MTHMAGAKDWTCPSTKVDPHTRHSNDDTVLDNTVRLVNRIELNGNRNISAVQPSSSRNALSRCLARKANINPFSSVVTHDATAGHDACVGYILSGDERRAKRERSAEKVF